MGLKDVMIMRLIYLRDNKYIIVNYEFFKILIIDLFFDNIS